MKKLLVLLLPLLLFSVSCENDDDKDEKFELNTDNLEFPVEGETKTFHVTYNKDGGSWTATTEDGWIELKDASGRADGTVTVIVLENDIMAKLEGTITVKADGFGTPLTISVIQKPFVPQEEPGHISLRSSWSRMNLKSYVRKLGSYIDYTAGRIELTDLEFNKYGMLTKFKAKEQGTLRDGNYLVEYAEDDPSRIVRISGNTPYNPDEFILEFQYGDHGKYIPTEDLFFQLDNQGTYTMWKMWLPRLIKDLDKVVFVKDLKPDVDDMEMYYEINGDTGELWVSSTVNGQPSSQAFQWLTFSGDYPIEVNYLWAGMGYPMNYYSIYDIDTDNGYFLSYDLSIERAFNWIERSYNSDGYNSYASLMDFDITGDTPYPMTYNANGDRITFGPAISFDYEYDGQGNWTKVTITGDGAARSIEREIEYWD